MAEPIQMIDRVTAAISARLQEAGGGGTSGGMEQRITRLEEQMVGVRDDLRDIKESLRLLPTLGTKRDLQNAILTGIGISVAVIGIVVGGLGWLETRAARVIAPPAASSAPTPIVIQLPPQNLPRITTAETPKPKPR